MKFCLVPEASVVDSCANITARPRYLSLLYISTGLQQFACHVIEGHYYATALLFN